jgi:cell division protein ZapA
MSNVTLDIAGRKFTVACGPGEEPHIEMLGRIISDKIEGMPGLSTQSEARCLLYASLLLADEVHELRKGEAPPPAALDPADDETVERLEALAESLERLAAALDR